MRSAVDSISPRSPAPVVHAAQRELELKVELLVVEELPRHLPLLT
jgi:hypothetical protein